MQSTFYTAVLAIIAIFLNHAAAHSWIEQMQVIGPDGNYTGPAGYPRGYCERASPGCSDTNMTYLLPQNSAGRTRVNGSDLVCMSTQRQANSNSAQFPNLVARPGDMVAMKYLENGHVSLPQNQLGKPGSGGLVYVYATTTPNSNQTLVDVLNWTTNNTLAQGRLLAVQNYDDGRCYQINSGAISQARQKEFPNPVPGQPGTVSEQWCETDIQVPTDAQAGSLTVYWVWQWPTLPNVDPGVPNGKDEIYTTCSDFHITTNSSTVNAAANPAAKSLIVQDPQKQANTAHPARAANTTLPTNVMFLGPGNNNPATSTASATTTGAGMIGNPTTSVAHVTGYSTMLTTTTTTPPVTVSTTTETVYVTVPPSSASTAPHRRHLGHGAKFRV